MTNLPNENAPKLLYETVRIPNLPCVLQKERLLNSKQEAFCCADRRTSYTGFSRLVRSRN